MEQLDSLDYYIRSLKLSVCKIKIIRYNEIVFIESLLEE